MPSIEDRATELRRFFPDRAVAAMLGIDRDELSDYREDPADPIAESGAFRDPRFSTLFAGGEYAFGAGADAENDIDYGSEDFIPVYTQVANNFGQGLAVADEYLLEIYLSLDWKLDDEGSDPENATGVIFSLMYGDERLPVAESQDGGTAYPIESDILNPSNLSNDFPDADGFYGLVLKTSTRDGLFPVVTPRNEGTVRMWGSPIGWIVQSIEDVSLAMRLSDQTLAAATEGHGVLRNVEIGVALSTQQRLADE
jgi:hypothetical protein